MNNTYQIYLISDSTGETLDRIFLALKAQFKDFNYIVHQYSFTRTENQVSKILNKIEKKDNCITRFLNLLPLLMLARVDGKSPVEYFNEFQNYFNNADEKLVSYNYIPEYLEKTI